MVPAKHVRCLDGVGFADARVCTGVEEGEDDIIVELEYRACNDGLTEIVETIWVCTACKKRLDQIGVTRVRRQHEESVPFDILSVWRNQTSQQELKKI
jgi:hypothetical protein